MQGDGLTAVGGYGHAEGIMRYSDGPARRCQQPAAGEDGDARGVEMGVLVSGGNGHIGLWGLGVCGDVGDEEECQCYDGRLGFATLHASKLSRRRLVWRGAKLSLHKFWGLGLFVPCLFAVELVLVNVLLEVVDGADCGRV